MYLRIWAACVLVGATGVLAACGDDNGSDWLLGGRGGADVGSAPERHRIDDRVAAYRGIGIRDSDAEVQAAFGHSPPLRGNPVTPLGRDHTEVVLSPAFDCSYPGPGPRAFMRYDQVAFFLDDKVVCGFVVIEDGAATSRGVAVGDSLREAEDAYPELECGIANEGSESPQFPYCAGEIRPLRYIWFGGDPINTIQMNTEPLY